MIETLGTVIRKNRQAYEDYYYNCFVKEIESDFFSYASIPTNNFLSLSVLLDNNKKLCSDQFALLADKLRYYLEHTDKFEGVTFMTVVICEKENSYQLALKWYLSKKVEDNSL